MKIQLVPSILPSSGGLGVEVSDRLIGHKTAGLASRPRRHFIWPFLCKCLAVQVWVSSRASGHLDINFAEKEKATISFTPTFLALRLTFRCQGKGESSSYLPLVKIDLTYFTTEPGTDTYSVKRVKNSLFSWE